MGNELILEKENIRYFKHSNRQLPITLNVGIQSAAGKYVTFLGSDDEYRREHISLRVDYMEANPHVDLIHGGVEIVGNPFVKDKNDLTRTIHVSECVVGGTFFGKKKVFTVLDGFKDIEYSEDSEFIERALSAFNVRKIDFPTYVYYRDTPDSICNTI